MYLEPTHGGPQQSCPIYTIVSKHQDGNDRFYLLAHHAISDVKPHADIEVLKHHSEIEAEHQEESARGVDAHFLVSTDVLPTLQDIMTRRGLRVVRELEKGGSRFVLLSSEIYGQQSDAADGYRGG